METATHARIRPGLLALAAASAGLLACADQPKPKCTVARGDFAATYKLVSGEGACAELAGEVLSVQAYNAANGDDTPNYDAASIGIQPYSISEYLWSGLAEPNPNDKPYALGDFDSAEPDADGFCTAPKLSVARLRYPEVPEQTDMCTTVPAQPAVDLEYVWSDVRVYTTASALGTQLSAKLTYTKDGCTAKYEVRAVYPSVSCGSELPPEPTDGGSDAAPPAELDAGTDAGATDGGAQECPPEAPAAGELVADESLCSPVADPDNGREVGSGLSPDFAIRCDPDLLLCVLRADPPSLR